MINTREIRACRARLGLNQTEMAALLGIKSKSPYATYSKKERGEARFTAEEWLTLSTIFGWDLTQSSLFLFGHDIADSQNGNYSDENSLNS